MTTNSTNQNHPISSLTKPSHITSQRRTIHFCPSISPARKEGKHERSTKQRELAARFYLTLRASLRYELLISCKVALRPTFNVEYKSFLAARIAAPRPRLPRAERKLRPSRTPGTFVPESSEPDEAGKEEPAANGDGGRLQATGMLVVDGMESCKVFDELTASMLEGFGPGVFGIVRKREESHAATKSTLAGSGPSHGEIPALTLCILNRDREAYVEPTKFTIVIARRDLSRTGREFSPRQRLPSPPPHLPPTF